MKQALFYEKHPKGVKCILCPHNCIIAEGKRGLCGVRQNNKGKLYSLVYGKTIATHIDPIEKKPLFNFFPGTKIYSFATAGCNLRCEFCQNWEISQVSKGRTHELLGEEKTPEQIVKEAFLSGCKSIAMTYNEPTIFFEYAYDVCIESKKKGLKTVFVSNGFINKAAINKISKYLDAINIDLKSFNNDFYKELCGAKLQPVLDAISLYHKKSVWVEITTLIIPGKNDSKKELRDIAKFIASIDRNIPWHISRFHPDYKMTATKLTSIEKLHEAYSIGKEQGLNYVYVGNVLDENKENTYCPKCNKLLIERQGFYVSKNVLKEDKCYSCNEKIAGIF